VIDSEDCRGSNALMNVPRFARPGEESVKVALDGESQRRLCQSYILVRKNMYRYRQSLILLKVAYGLLIFCLAERHPLLVGGFFKVVASLFVACLLAFIVVHSAHIWRLLIASLHAIPVRFFPRPVDLRWERSQTPIAVPNEPSLAALFQRPPPIFSL